jgi:hypothetical protein
MPWIANTAVIPQISADFHLLEIEEIAVVEVPKYGEPDMLEERLKLQLRVCTPGEADESFAVWMSPKLSEKATFGAIVKAVLGAIPADPKFDTDVLLGCRFRHMTSHNERGWPKLVPGTAAAAKQSPGESESPV